MIYVIRRLGILLALVLTVGACAGAERDAVSVGDHSISRADLVDLVVAVWPGDAPDPNELPATLSAQPFRDVANTWINDAAIATALSEQGIVMTEEERVAINGQIEDVIVDGQIGNLLPLTGGYEALQRNIWVSTSRNLLDETSGARADQLIRDADVESRLGSVDPETSLIVAR